MIVQELLDHIAQLQKRFPDVDVMNIDIWVDGGSRKVTEVELYSNGGYYFELDID